MGNYTILQMFENPRRGKQARNFTTNAPKIVGLKSSSEQIFSRKLPLGAPGTSIYCRTLIKPITKKTGKIVIFEATYRTRKTRIPACPLGKYSHANFVLPWDTSCWSQLEIYLCQCIGTKESACIRKEFNSHRTGLGHQHCRRDDDLSVDTTCCLFYFAFVLYPFQCRLQCLLLLIIIKQTLLDQFH